MGERLVAMFAKRAWSGSRIRSRSGQLDRWRSWMRVRSHSCRNLFLIFDSWVSLVWRWVFLNFLPFFLSFFWGGAESSYRCMCDTKAGEKMKGEKEMAIYRYHRRPNLVLCCCNAESWGKGERSWARCIHSWCCWGYSWYSWSCCRPQGEGYLGIVARIQPCTARTGLVRFDWLSITRGIQAHCLGDHHEFSHKGMAISRRRI